MGKVHRIKRDFHRLVTRPLVTGNHPLAGGLATIYIGKRIHSWSKAYHPLVKRLIKEYEAGVGHTDKGSVTG